MNRPCCAPFHAWTAFVLLSVLSLPVPAAQRVALVIGNAQYRHTTPLLNPRNDAADVAGALEDLGFEVIEGIDVDKGAFGSMLREFAKAARGAEVTLFFYAGHGLQVEGKNYLVPTDAKLVDEVDLDLEAFELAKFMRQMRGGTNLVLLDACRDNPLASNLVRSMGPTRSAAVGRGLGRVETGSGTLIAYATQPGNVADDGEGRNSPFTGALLAHIATPGLSVDALLARVTDDVMKRTGERQQPWRHSSLRKPFYFKPASAPTTAVPGASTASPPSGGAAPAGAAGEQLAARAYEAAERIDTVEAYEAVVRRFPESIYAELAQTHIAKLIAARKPAAGAAVASASPQPAVPASTPAAPTREAMESSLGLERGERRRVQQGLASLGYAPGPADGLFGARTREAIRRYQGEKGFEATGYLSAEESEALVALGEEAAQAKAEAERREARRRAESEARRADDAAFAGAKTRGTVEAYGAYLEGYPAGRHVVEVRRLRTEAERLERERREKAPGRRFRDCAECPEVVVVASGSFMMGSPGGEDGRDDDEDPVHRVRIVEPFAVGVMEVTRGEFGRFVRETGHSTGNACRTHEGGEWKERSGRSWRIPGFSQADGHPVVCVSWEDAQSYVRWLSGETGKRYRLLSESEWEYVARGGTRTSRHWGDRASDACQYANVADRSAKEKYTRWAIHECRDGYVHTAPTGSFVANPYGLHDALGNVWEWVEDCWHDDYDGAPTDGSAWTSGGGCSRRVLRGGSWGNSPGFVRSANRSGSPSGNRDSLVGFRVARTLN